MVISLKELDVDEDEEFANVDEMWPDLPKISDMEDYFEEDE